MEGFCQDMCPKREREERIKNQLVNLLETDTPWNSPTTALNNLLKRRIGKTKPLIQSPQLQMVKEYSRSAADKQIRAEDVRPFPVLKKTVEYLIEK